MMKQPSSHDYRGGALRPPTRRGGLSRMGKNQRGDPVPRPFGSRILRCFRKERGLVKRHVPKRDWYDYARLILQALAVATPYVILYLTH